MSEGVPYADIIILALIAGFILLRLRSVLGSRSEDDPKGFDRFIPTGKEPVVRVEEKSRKARPKEEIIDDYLAKLEDHKIAEVLASIKEKDPQFSASEFLQGAKMAYEMVFDAFTKADQVTLKLLLSDDLFRTFKAELEAREKQEQKTETTLVSATAGDITSAELNRSIARLGVKFVSEQVILTRSAKGEVVEGDPSEIHRVEDHWVFERDVTSKNPNWKIVET